MNITYSNQKEIDKVQKEIAEISPDLKLSSFAQRWDSDHVFEVGVELLLKGNKHIIEKLVSIGFVKGRKRSITNTWSQWHMRTEPHVYVIQMKKRLPESDD